MYWRETESVHHASVQKNWGFKIKICCKYYKLSFHFFHKLSIQTYNELDRNYLCMMFYWECVVQQDLSSDGIMCNIIFYIIYWLKFLMPNACMPYCVLPCCSLEGLVWWRFTRYLDSMCSVEGAFLPPAPRLQTNLRVWITPDLLFLRFLDSVKYQSQSICISKL